MPFALGAILPWSGNINGIATDAGKHWIGMITATRGLCIFCPDEIGRAIVFSDE